MSVATDDMRRRIRARVRVCRLSLRQEERTRHVFVYATGRRQRGGGGRHTNAYWRPFHLKQYSVLCRPCTTFHKSRLTFLSAHSASDSEADDSESEGRKRDRPVGGTRNPARKHAKLEKCPVGSFNRSNRRFRVMPLGYVEIRRDLRQSGRNFANRIWKRHATIGIPLMPDFFIYG